MFEFFSQKGFKTYLQKAQRILEGNWTGNYTKPSPGLYPHQWNWDSGFIALGYAHYNQARAQQEIKSLFAQQWDNGMVPQIVFNPDALGHYFPEPDFWQVPGGRPTSGITMPPLHAISCRAIYDHAANRPEAKDFLAYMFPRLLASHRYFYEQRDPQHIGLVYIRHPWESGLDNSPNWDGPLAAIEIDWAKLPPYQRKDLDHGVPAAQRPSDQDYDRYVFLVDLFRRLNYDEAAIYRDCPFLVQDVLFNSILCRANRDLEEIGEIIGSDVREVAQWREQTSRAIAERLWSPSRGQFDPFCLVSQGHLPTATASSFMPLFAVAASPEQAEVLYQRIDSVSFCALHQGNCFTIPNFDMTQEGFDPQNYWRGPVWLNINWMLSQGLKSYGFQQKSDAMKKDMIQLPVRFGFHEYFDSVSGQGYGADNFGWTAALFIDLVHQYYQRDKHVLHWPGMGPGRKLAEHKVLNQAPASAPRPMPDLSSRLMARIGELKDTFYNMERGRVDYASMKQSAQYRRYLELAAQLKAFDLGDLGSRQEKLAFWINLYNTLAVQGIVELDITESVRQVGNFFSHLCYQIGPHTFSLDEMEHGILRGNARPPYRIFPLFKVWDKRRGFVVPQPDNRVHFALVCGSRSCAPIRFYQAAKIDEQLEAAARGFVNSSEVVVLPEENKIMLSQIFNWYQNDFGGRQEVFRFLLRYLAPDAKRKYLQEHLADIKVEYLFYDWNLNH